MYRYFRSIELIYYDDIYCTTAGWKRELTRRIAAGCGLMSQSREFRASSREHGSRNAASVELTPEALQLRC